MLTCLMSAVKLTLYHPYSRGSNSLASAALDLELADISFNASRTVNKKDAKAVLSVSSQKGLMILNLTPSDSWSEI